MCLQCLPHPEQPLVRGIQLKEVGLATGEVGKPEDFAYRPLGLGGTGGCGRQI
jgi:hypothetical protein